MRRCLHENKRSHTFKNGDVMWLCECGAGGGHVDQSVPSQGKLYRKGGVVESEPDDSILDTTDDPEEEIAVAELTLPTFAALEDESEVPILERGDSDEEESDTSEEEGVDGSMSKSYDNLKNEAEVDAALKAAIQRGDSEKKIDALLEQYEPPKPTPEGSRYERKRRVRRGWWSVHACA